MATQHSQKTVSAWLERILGHEGGYSDNPDDPGNWTGGKVGEGELKGTKWGIAANTYGQFDLDIKTLTVEQAADIYIQDYLGPIKASDYEDGVAFQMLDFAVNSGPRNAKRALQRAIGVKDDGAIGPVTLSRLSKYSESVLIMLLTAERIDFMTSLGAWDDFGKGWARRLAGNLRYGAQDSD